MSIEQTTTKKRSSLKMLKSTGTRTFFFYPIPIIALEWILEGGEITFVAWGVPLLIAGFLMHYAISAYRTKLGGGGPGLSNPPERLVTTGPFRITRNPMYMGHMVFILGLAVTFQSLPALLLVTGLLHWYDERAREDERQLEGLFGERYEAYKNRVPRWLPGLPR
jgi:protein-S-isoprenylcysteine O-methyltransferase Ste14